MRTLGILLLALIFLAGCSSNTQPDSMNGMVHESNTAANATKSSSPSDEAANVTPEVEKRQYKLDATIQQDGDQYSIKVKTDLTFSQDHYGLAHQVGEGHIHFFVNNGLIGPIMSNGLFPIDSGLLLSEGENIIKLVLAGNDHSEPYNAFVELKIDKK
jgi:hypothetical protein